MPSRPSSNGLTPGDPLEPDRSVGAAPSETARRAPSAPPADPDAAPRAPRAVPADADSASGATSASSQRPRTTTYGDSGPWASPAAPPAWGAPAPAPAVESRGLVLAGWWRRAGAQLIDGAIILAITLALFVPLGIGAFDDDPSLVALALGAVVATLIATAVAFLYAPLLMARTNGQTLGRMATGIRVVRANGQPMTFGWAMLREVAVKYLLFGVASSFTAGIASLLDVLWPLWDEENRALHDFLADTRVVRA